MAALTLQLQKMVSAGEAFLVRGEGFCARLRCVLGCGVCSDVTPSTRWGWAAHQGTVEALLHASTPCTLGQDV